MLKRNQVLLNDWLVDIIKEMAEKYDISFSETIRIFVCLQLGKMISYAHPGYDFSQAMNKTEEIVAAKNRGKAYTMEELHNAISQLYFESRKAAEYWYEQEAKAKKLETKKEKNSKAKKSKKK
jgi:hypothetical protein